MKSAYMILMFFVMIQLVAIILNSTGVFPDGYGLYGDFDMEELEQNMTSPVDVLSYIFLPKESFLGEFGFDAGFTLTAIIGIIIGAGILTAAVTGSFVPAVLAIVSLAVIPMITKSLTFFSKIFTHWDVLSMTYLGILFGIGVLMLFFFYIIEQPTHGRSGG